MVDPRTLQQCYELIGIALRPATPLNEACDAIARMMHLARSAGITADDLYPPSGWARTDGLPYGGDPAATLFPFGKYAGQSIRTVLKTNPNYCDWVLKNCPKADPYFLGALRQALTLPCN
ncbi:MAG: hypothetical protein ACP5QA_12065 [Phycisphaerae bacterium]